jgi:hypothetical protein
MVPSTRSKKTDNEIAVSTSVWPESFAFVILSGPLLYRLESFCCGIKPGPRFPPISKTAPQPPILLIRPGPQEESETLH